MPFFRANFFLEDRNLQGHKPTNITVTATAKADIAVLPKHEQKALFSTSLKRMGELMQGGEEK